MTNSSGNEMEQRSAGGRKLGLVFFFVVFVAAAVLVALQGQRPEPRTAPAAAAVLADGREIHLETVTYGELNKVVFVSEREWQREKLPAFMTKGIPKPRVLTFMLHTNTLMAWLTITNHSKAMPLLEKCHIVSDKGESMPMDGEIESTRLWDGRVVLCPNTRSFPRREHSFSLTGLVDRLPFAVRLTNPAPRVGFPSWTPVALPATNHIDGVEYVLLDAPIVQLPGQNIVEPELLAFRNGSDVTRFIASSFEVADPTGNRTHVSTNEPAWKLEFDIKRKFPYSWITNDFLEIPMPRLLATGEVQNVTGTVLGGMGREVFYLGGPGAFAYDPATSDPPRRIVIAERPPYARWSDKFEWSFQGHWLMAKFMGMRTDATVRVFVRDQSGKSLEVRSGRSYFDLSYRASLISLDNGRDHRRMKKGKGIQRIEDLTQPPYTIRVVIRTNLQTEFVVDPSKLRRVGP